jgi:membrane protease YdiL (CAAX protease family)
MQIEPLISSGDLTVELVYNVASKMNDISVVNSELPVPPAEKRVWGPWATAGFGVVILVVLFLVMVFIMVILAVGVALYQMDTTFTIEGFTDSIYSYMGLFVSISGIVAYAAGTGLTLTFIKARGGAGIAEYLGLRRIGWKVPLVLILITAVLVILEVLISKVVQVTEADSKIMVDIYNTAVWPVLLWTLVVIFAPIFEEVLFRGFLFEGFIRSRLGLIGTIFLTSLIWTGLHAGYGLYSLGTIFVIGIVMGIIRYKTGSLWSTMLLHALYNGVGMTLIALNVS